VQAAMTGRPGEHRLDRLQCDTCGFDMDVRPLAAADSPADQSLPISGTAPEQNRQLTVRIAPNWG
jgi:hypothetical protein